MFIHWLPSVVAYDYLKSIDQLDDNKKQTINKKILAGYQKIVANSKNGINAESFKSYWHKSIMDDPRKFKPDTSTVQSSYLWNAAYLAKLMIAAKHAASIDDKYIVEMLDYVVKKQNETDGSFHDRVHLSHYNSAKVNDTKVPLTAFIVSTLIEKDADAYKNATEAGIEYLKSQVGSMKIYFEMAITAYAISLHSTKALSPRDSETLANLLKTLIKESVQTSKNKRMYWHQSREQKWSPSVAVKIETAAYALMAMIKSPKRNDYVVHILRIMNYLLSMRTSYGGFSSSHDTVVAIRALGEASKIFVKVKTNLSVEFNYDRDLIEPFNPFNVLEANANDIQQEKLQRVPAGEVHINANGAGIAFAAVTCEYVEKVDKVGGNFELDVGAELTDNDTVVSINIVTRAMVENATADVSGTSLIEVQLPSGYEFRNEEKMYKLLAKHGVMVRIVIDRFYFEEFFSELRITFFAES